jgi:hypothetical protein
MQMLGSQVFLCTFLEQIKKNDMQKIRPLGLLLFFLICAQGLEAQSGKEPMFDPDVDKPSKIIIHGGAARQFSRNKHNQLKLCIERPLTHYHQVGLEFNSYLLENPDYDFNISRGTNLEIAGTFKYFPSGRFTGRKSGFYFASDMRWGTRNVTRSLYVDPIDSGFETLKENSVKMMFRIGRQRVLHNFVIDWGLPIGFERSTVKNISTNAPKTNSSPQFVFAPSFTLGWAL